jgi:hypothetical protein
MMTSQDLAQIKKVKNIMFTMIWTQVYKQNNHNIELRQAVGK